MKKKKSKINNKMYILILIAFIFGVILSISVSYALAATLVNSKDVYYEDNSSLAVNNVQAAIDGTCTKFSNQLQEFLLKVYPVGSIYISYNSTNPSSLFGGTWENYGSGRVLKGINSGTAGQTGGSDAATLKISNLPAHTHDISHTHTTTKTTTSTMSLTAESAGEHSHNGNLSFAGKTGGTKSVNVVSEFSGANLLTLPAGAHTHNVSGTVTIPELTTKSSSLTSGSTGSGEAFSIQNPYITVYMWRRTK